MRTIRYTLMPDIAGSFLEKEASLAAFARDLSWVFIHKNIPPLRILNQAFENGDSPREAEWEPFSITDTEYRELVDDLLANPDENYKQYQAPDDIQTFEDWTKWLQLIGL